MPDNNLPSSNMGRRRTGEKVGWPTACTRLPLEQYHLLNTAAAQRGQVRADFIAAAIRREIETVLGVTLTEAA